MGDVTEPDRRIIDYLRESVGRGERYFRSKNIAEAIGLSAKEVGARLPHLDDKADTVEIEKWGRARSTTWRVEPA
jgi:DNA-binding Lrp family transcriptional regulator